MTREDIIRMAREAGLTVCRDEWVFGEMLERFAALVAAAEREACARICDAVQKKNEDDGAWLWEAKNCAAAIRARGQA
jgi:hypothetical protein